MQKMHLNKNKCFGLKTFKISYKYIDKILTEKAETKVSAFLIPVTSKACFNEFKEIKNKLHSGVGFFQNVDSGTQRS